MTSPGCGKRHAFLVLLCLLSLVRPASPASGATRNDEEAAKIAPAPLNIEEFREQVWMKMAEMERVPMPELVRRELEMLDDDGLSRMIGSLSREIIRDEIRGLVWLEFRELDREEMRMMIRPVMDRAIQAAIQGMAGELVAGVPVHEIETMVRLEYSRLVTDESGTLRTTIQRAVLGSIMRESFIIARELVEDHLRRLIRPMVEEQIGAVSGQQMDEISRRAVREIMRAGEIPVLSETREH